MTKGNKSAFGTGTGTATSVDTSVVIARLSLQQYEDSNGRTCWSMENLMRPHAVHSAGRRCPTVATIALTGSSRPTTCHDAAGGGGPGDLPGEFAKSKAINPSRNEIADSVFRGCMAAQGYLFWAGV